MNASFNVTVMYNTVLIAHGRGRGCTRGGDGGVIKGVGSKTEKQKKRVGRGMQKGHQGCVRVKEVCCHPDGCKMEMGRT